MAGEVFERGAQVAAEGRRRADPRSRAWTSTRSRAGGDRRPPRSAPAAAAPRPCSPACSSGGRRRGGSPWPGRARRRVALGQQVERDDVGVGDDLRLAAEAAPRSAPPRSRSASPARRRPRPAPPSARRGGRALRGSGCAGRGRCRRAACRGRRSSADQLAQLLGVAAVEAELDVEEVERVGVVARPTRGSSIRGGHQPRCPGSRSSASRSTRSPPGAPRWRT